MAYQCKYFSLELVITAVLYFCKLADRVTKKNNNKISYLQFFQHEIVLDLTFEMTI